MYYNITIMLNSHTKARSFTNKKRFGQNFLIDKNILCDIVAKAAICKSDCVLEIGPGQGVLTLELLAAGCGFLHSIEIDETLRPWLSPIEENNNERLRLHFTDAVKFDYSTLDPFPNKVVANIPYNVTTPLIHELVKFASEGLRKLVLTVQLEAAQRLMAKADSKERYPLGVTLEAMGDVKILRAVPRTCFRPIPNVDSCVMEINLANNFELGKDDGWNTFLHAGFRQRRKMLVNNLKGLRNLEAGYWISALQSLNIDPKIRAEDLSCDEWRRLYDIAKSFLNTAK